MHLTERCEIKLKVYHAESQKRIRLLYYNVIDRLSILKLCWCFTLYPLHENHYITKAISRTFVISSFGQDLIYETKDKKVGKAKQNAFFNTI